MIQNNVVVLGFQCISGQQFEDLKFQTVFGETMPPSAPKTLVSSETCMAYHSNINYLVPVLEVCTRSPSPDKNHGYEPVKFREIKAH